MGNIGVINAAGLSSRAFEILEAGDSALDRAASVLLAMPETEQLWILGGPGEESRGEAWRDRGFRTEFRPFWGERDLFTFLAEVSRGFRDLFYLYGDCALADPELAGRMYGDHRKYFAQYTFADGYPQGISPEILDTSILTSLAGLAGEENLPVVRDSLFRVISRDINSFDLETILSPRDMRMLRVSLTMDTKRNAVLLRKILELGGRGEDSILKILEEKPEILRTLPAFAEFQVTNGFLQSPSYLPAFPGQTLDPAAMKFLDPDEFRIMADRFARFAQDGTVNLGFRGEPSLHPEILRLAGMVLEHPELRVLMETSGLGWKEEHWKELEGLDTERIDWIITLDSQDPGVYRDLRGPGQEEALAATEELLRRFPRRVWVQAVRLKETEESLEAFYRYWKGRTDNVIIQKYDSYCGILPPRKVTDLSPLKRFPCWHLKRDLPVLMDGRVLLCREELENPRILGNLLEEEPEALWQRGEPVYREQIRGVYPSRCGNCDEYYTFNY